MNLRSKNVLVFYLNDFPKLKHFKLVFGKVWLSFYSIYCFGKVPQFFKVPFGHGKISYASLNNVRNGNNNCNENPEENDGKTTNQTL